MDRHGYAQCTPRRQATSIADKPVLDLTSGYVQRALGTLPRQGARKPWKIHQNYVRDLLSMRLSRVNDGTMEFKRRGGRASQKARRGRAWKLS
jgi:hypothetical protein